MSTYRRIRVPVRGGGLAAAVWEPEVTDVTTTVLAIHGITASHLAWLELVAALPDVRVVAPDLRGRGASSTLPGPWGMPQHAEDMLALVDSVGAERVLVVGHSMGGFVSGEFATTYPDRVTGVILIDGGLPLPLPEGVTEADLPQALIGPAADRLSMTFPDRESYRAFWRNHPAFADAWGENLEAYVDYDLVGTAPAFHAASSLEAVTEDSRQLASDTGYIERLNGLTVPLHFLRAHRGLLNQPEALYPPERIEYWASRVPALRVNDVRDVNHYTIVMSPEGIASVVPVVRDLLEAPMIDKSNHHPAKEPA